MAGVFTFHNKFHRANHHTLSGTGIVDAGLDSIASFEFPFQGIFYNNITDINRTFSIQSNSLEWYSAYTTMQDNSANWMLTRSVYTSVSSLSDNWNLGFNGYTTLQANSTTYDSTFLTVSTLSAEWGSPFLMFTNKAQEYTQSKTFSGQPLTLGKSIIVDEQSGLITELDIPGLSTYGWNLTDQQVGFLTLTKDTFLLNPEEDTILNGGLYTLVIKQSGNNDPDSWDLTFDSAYRFNERNFITNIINREFEGTTVIYFIAINNIMYGDVTLINTNE